MEVAEEETDVEVGIMGPKFEVRVEKDFIGSSVGDSKHMVLQSFLGHPAFGLTREVRHEVRIGPVSTQACPVRRISL